MRARRRPLALLAVVATGVASPAAVSAQSLTVPPLATTPEPVKELVQTTRAEVDTLLRPTVAAVAAVVPEPVAGALGATGGQAPPGRVAEEGGISIGVARAGRAPLAEPPAEPVVPKPESVGRPSGRRRERTVPRRPGRPDRRGAASGAKPEVPGNAQPPRVAIDLVEVLPPAVLALLIALAASSLLATGGSFVSETRARGLRRERSVLLDDAGVLERALAPDVPERVGPLGVSVGFRPADGPAAGGDFYDVVPLSSGRVAVIVGDVVGHGSDAVAHAALVRHALRAWLELGLPPGLVLRLAGHGRIGSEEEMATAIVAVYDPSEGTLSYACAGHPEPLILGADAGKRRDIPCVSGPLGVDLPTGRRTTTISLPPGALACLYTDGVVEARTADGLFGSDRLLALLEREGPEATAAGLLDVVAGESERTPDDMAICLLRPLVGSAEVACQIEELEISADEVQAAENFLADCGVPPKTRRTVTATAARDAVSTGRAFLRVSWPDGKPRPEVLSAVGEPHWLAETLAAPR